MRKSSKHITLSRFLTLITTTPIVIMGVFVLSTMFYQMHNTIATIEASHIEREVEYMRSTVISFLDVRKTALQTVAAQPVVIQGALHPKENSDNIKDYLDHLMILSKDYNTSLYDFKGELLYKEAEKAVRDYNTSSWMQSMLSGELDYYIGTVEDNLYWWLIAVPIKYNDSVEGVIAAEIPIADIFEDAELSSMPTRSKFDLYSGDSKVISFGNDVEGISRSETIEEMGIQIVFTFDTSESTSAINNLTITFVTIMAFFTILTSLLLVYFGKRFVALPVNEIRCMAMQLADGDKKSIQLSDSRILELQAMTQQFIDMSNKIEDRENALIQANTDLETKHEELKETMERLEDAQVQMIQQEKLASIGHLAAGVAHELNNPIGFVTSNFSVLKDYFEELSDFIKSKCTDDLPDNVQFVLEDVPELVSDSQEGLTRVTSIVKNLRDFSRVDNFERSDYSLNDGINSTLIVAKNEYKYVADIERDLADLPTIYAKGSEINDVLLNLIINATHAISSLNMDEKGTIRIRTYATNEYVCAEIADNGPGIHESVIGRIFDPFFTTKEPGKGTGLGLNIAYNTIVNKHNGVLMAESNYGEGATFIMKLPIENTQPHPEDLSDGYSDDVNYR